MSEMIQIRNAHRNRQDNGWIFESERLVEYIDGTFPETRKFLLTDEALHESGNFYLPWEIDIMYLEIIG